MPNSDVPQDNPTRPETPDWAGLQLPAHYEIEGEIGRGGMGTVLRARDLKHGRKVAIKVLRPEIAHAFGRDRFLREIRTAAQLVHPNIVTVFDSGEAGGTLYYVMPYVEGESLRERLNRDERLDITQAVHISREIADALSFAHAAGVVHRDIKPENILLSKNNHAWLTDFGVARAIAVSANPRLTSTGVLVGSPLYASPEQLQNEGSVDGRSDIYSLACVLYEMLAGKPPFLGENASALILQHLIQPAQPLSRIRSDVAGPLNDAVLKALSKPAHDRFQSVQEFGAALTLSPQQRRGFPASIVRRRLVEFAAAISFIALVTIATKLARNDKPSGSGAVVRFDTTRVLIAPFAADSASETLGFEERISEAFARWLPLTVVDAPADLLQRRSSQSDQLRIARRLNAGRIVTGTMSTQGDSVRIRAELRDANQESVILARQVIVVSQSGANLGESTMTLADSLLLRGGAPECLAAPVGTRSLIAIRQCDLGFSALQDGDLAAADSAFTEAIKADPEYSRPRLWLAEARSWIIENASDVSALLVKVSADTRKLSAREIRLATARSYLNKGSFDAACAVYDSLVAIDSNDWMAWLGVGECRRRDESVHRDRSSLSGWSFRTSYNEALSAYERAFQLNPGLLAAYRPFAFREVRKLLMTSGTDFRRGKAIRPDTGSFFAHAAVDADSLAFVPYTQAEWSAARTGTLPKTYEAAVDRQRDVFRGIAETWVAKYPSNSAALEALSLAQELNGDRSSIATSRRARALARSVSDQLRLAVTEVSLTIKFGLPDNTSDLDFARELADSVVRNIQPATSDDGRAFAMLALLIGQPAAAARAARLTASPVAKEIGVPVGVAEPARALLAFAAAGAPVDSMKQLEREFESSLANVVSSDRRDGARISLLSQATMVAFPRLVLDALATVGPTGAFTSAELALVRRDTGAVHQQLAALRAARKDTRPADLTIDGLLVEASLLAQLGARAEAAARLDPTLGAIRWLPPARLADFVQVGTLVRAMILRADLASLANDSSTARRWAAPVAILWQQSDPSLRQDIVRMQGLLKHSRPADQH